MPSFEGTVQEFHNYIGPRIRNVVNSLTRKPRLERNGICEFCGKKGTLESAHVHGKGRRKIIEDVLRNYTNGKTIRIHDLNIIEQEILDAHLPLSKTFKFICKPCHTEYDSNYTKAQSSHRIKIISKESSKEKESFSKLHKIKCWGGEPTQKNHKIIQAFRAIERKKGKVLLSDLEYACTLGTSFSIGNRRQFFNNLNSMKTDSGHSHGKVFYLYGDEIKIYDVVKNRIEEYFPKL